MARFDLSILGLTAATEATVRARRALQPRGALGTAVREVTVGAQRLAIAHTHVQTGALRGAQRMSFNGLYGTVYIDENALNPRSHRRVIGYAFVEHARGYPHNFYQQVMAQSDTLVDRAVNGLVKALDG